MAASRRASGPGLPAPSAGISRTPQMLGAGLAALSLPAVTVTLAEHREDLVLRTPVLLMLTVVLAVAIVGESVRPSQPPLLGSCS